MTDVTYYTSLIPSANQPKPNFIATLQAILQPIQENINALNSMPGLFDIDTAVGDQLDKVGQWVGPSRYLTQSVGGVTVLDDIHYRLYLRASILRNHWDGTIPNAYAIWNALGTGYQIIIIDNQDMTMLFGLIGGTPDAVTLALLLAGYLTPRPMGVLSLGYFTNFPLFGLDIENSFISGFDVGYIV